MITDADFDLMNVGAEHVASVARDLATNAIRVRDQHRRQVDALKLDVADLKAEVCRQQQEIARLTGDLERARRGFDFSIEDLAEISP